MTLCHNRPPKLARLDHASDSECATVAVTRDDTICMRLKPPLEQKKARTLSDNSHKINANVYPKLSDLEILLVPKETCTNPSALLLVSLSIIDDRDHTIALVLEFIVVIAVSLNNESIAKCRNTAPRPLIKIRT
jgi:hypothetical protein